MKHLLLFTALIIVGCSAPQRVAAAYDLKRFTELSKESWGSWDVYILRHDASRACFVVLDIPGDGGGSIASAPSEVCALQGETAR